MSNLVSRPLTPSTEGNRKQVLSSGKLAVGSLTGKSSVVNSPFVRAMYTDGACSGNPGPGGWGAIAYLSDGRVHEIGGFVPETTNNRMELQAAIEILQWFLSSSQTTPPTLYTDSKYVQDGITQWIKGWKKKHWKTSAGKAVLNQDLWQALDAVTQSVNAQLETPIRWRYVKGHTGNEGNERCDAIAHSFSQGHSPSLSTVMPWDSTSHTLVVESDSVTTAPEKNMTGPMSSTSTLGTNPAPQPQSSSVSLSQPPSMTATDTSHNMQWIIERLRILDELAVKGYWITTAELARLVDLSPSTINSKGDRWTWRNWSMLKVKSNSPSVLWCLERLD